MLQSPAASDAGASCVIDYSEWGESGEGEGEEEEGRRSSSIGRPPRLCNTLGRPDFILVPSPAARMTMCRGLLMRLRFHAAVQLDSIAP